MSVFLSVNGAKTNVLLSSGGEFTFSPDAPTHKFILLGAVSNIGVTAGAAFPLQSGGTFHHYATLMSRVTNIPLTVDGRVIDSTRLDKYLLPFSNATATTSENAFIFTVKTDNLGTSTDVQFSLPVNGGTFLFDADWGDATTSEGLTGNTTHTYAVAGTYTIKITGIFPNICFNDGGDKLKLLEVSQWGNIVWGTLEDAFFGCANFNLTATDKPNFSVLASLRNCFRGCSLFNGDISQLDTSSVTNIIAMFRGCTIFNQPVNHFDLTNITQLISVFAECPAFNQSVSNWDTTGMTSFTNLFRSCTIFNQDVSHFNIESLTVATDMFEATAFSQTNYDKLLIAWEAQTELANVVFSAGLAKYGSGAPATAKAALEAAPSLWIITDGGAV